MIFHHFIVLLLVLNPPYNIEKTDEDAYRITLAVAGFADDELNIEAKDGHLVVSGKKIPAEGDVQYLHRGIAERAFERRFQLADHVRSPSKKQRRLQKPPNHCLIWKTKGPNRGALFCYCASMS